MSSSVDGEVSREPTQERSRGAGKSAKQPQSATVVRDLRALKILLAVPIACTGRCHGAWGKLGAGLRLGGAGLYLGRPSLALLQGQARRTLRDARAVTLGPFSLGGCEPGSFPSVPTGCSS